MHRGLSIFAGRYTVFSGATERWHALPPLTTQPVGGVAMAVPHLIRFRHPRKNLVGQRFGRLTVISWAGDSRWLCKCDCGQQTKAITANLKRGNTSSCGCIRNARASRRATTHGFSKTRAYKTWLSVRRRCYDPNTTSYKDYGAKGIRVHEAWRNDCVKFIADVGQPPSDNHTLDRINPLGHYEPGNVRWATPLEQGCNKTNNRWVTYQGGRYTISQLARKVASECGIEARQFLRAFEKVIRDA